MAFRLFRGKTKMMYFRKTDTTAASSLRDGSLVGITDSANLTYLAGDSTDRVLGVCRLRVTAADTSSWPGAPLVPVQVPIENAVEWLIDADTDGSQVDTDVIGRYFGVDTATDSDSESTRVDVSDTTIPQLFGTGRPDSDHVIAVIAKTVWNRSYADSADTTA